MRSVQRILADVLDKEREVRKNRERSGKFNPSSFGQCFRRQIWNRMNVEPSNPPDNRTLLVFKCGTLFHDFIQGLMTADTAGLGIEVRVEEDDVLGYADVVSNDEVIDIKSQHSFAFKYMHEEGFDVETDKIDHVMQVSYYAIRLGKPNYRMVYVSKDDLLIEEYSRPVGEWVKMKLEEELKTLREYWANKTIPEAKPRLYKDKKTGKCKECTYCQMKDKCDEYEKTNITKQGE